MRGKSFVCILAYLCVCVVFVFVCVYVWFALLQLLGEEAATDDVMMTPSCFLDFKTHDDVTHQYFDQSDFIFV